MSVQRTPSLEGTVDFLASFHAHILELLTDESEAADWVPTRHDCPGATVDDLADLAGRFVRDGLPFFVLPS